MLQGPVCIQVKVFKPSHDLFANQIVMDGAPLVSAEHLKAPYAERWDLLKDVMAWLYMEYSVDGKKLKLKEIVKIMEQNYKFFASSVTLPFRLLSSNIDAFDADYSST